MIHIVGCDHWLQPAEIHDIGDDAIRIAEEHHNAFSAELEPLFRIQPPGFVGEECRPDEDTIPRRLARQYRWNHRMIDIAELDRRRFGIPDQYARVYEANSSEVLRCHLIRERFMFERVQMYRENAHDVIVICGSEHVGRLSKLFVDAGETVQSKDVTKAAWFNPPWDQR